MNLELLNNLEITKYIDMQLYWQSQPRGNKVVFALHVYLLDSSKKF